MLRISVLSIHGHAPEIAQSAQFGPEGGSIGREEGNTLLLDDPGKHLSRVQASIKWLGGEYFLVDQGGNPSRVNARELGKGKVVSLHDGDRIVMADWELLVEYLGTPGRAHASLVNRQSVAASEPELQATELIEEEQAFDFQLAENTQVSAGPDAALALLEAFMRGLGVRGMALPVRLDAVQAERMGEQLRLLFNEPQVIEPDALKTQLGAVLQAHSEDAATPATGELPC